MTQKKTIDEAIKEFRIAESKIDEGSIGWGTSFREHYHKALALLERAGSSYEPTASEISSYISAWDGDITDEQARVLLKEANRKDEQLPQFEDIVGLYKDEERTEPDGQEKGD